VPDVIRTEWERARPGFINFLTADLAKVRAHSAHDVALSAAEARYPVVMLGGGGSGTSGLSFSTLAEDLASHGYIVASVDAAAGRNPELCVGRADEEGCATAVMTPLVARIGQALDSLRNLSSDDARFKDRLDVVFRGLLRLLGRLHLDGRRQVDITAYALRTFLDAHLKGKTGWRSAFTSPAYPELVESP